MKSQLHSNCDLTLPLHYHYDADLTLPLHSNPLPLHSELQTHRSYDSANCLDGHDSQLNDSQLERFSHSTIGLVERRTIHTIVWLKS